MGALPLVSAGCGAAFGHPDTPVPLYLAIVVALFVMGVKGLVRFIGELLSGGTHLLVRLIRLALVVGFFTAAVVVAAMVYATLRILSVA